MPSLLTRVGMVAAGLFVGGWLARKRHLDITAHRMPALARRLPSVTPVPGGDLDVGRVARLPEIGRCPLLVLRLAPGSDRQIARCMGARDGPVVADEYAYAVCENDRHQVCPYFVYAPDQLKDPPASPQEDVPPAHEHLLPRAGDGSRDDPSARAVMA